MARLISSQHLVIYLALICEISCAVENVKKKCKDWSNKEIDDGEEFIPNKEDPCHVCVCNNGIKQRCKAVSCSSPPCENYKPVDGVCCKFTCLDDKSPKSNGGMPNYTQPVDTGGSTDGSADSITTLGLRLVASTVTSFLVLALLLFMVHRIRQRRLMLAMRRYHNNRRREELDDHGYDAFTQQEYVGIQSPPPYEDPPPPYSPPKPHPRIMPTESPPPYEAVDSNQNISNNNNNDVQCQTDHSDILPTDNRLCSGSANNSINQNGLPQDNQSDQCEISGASARSDSIRTVASSQCNTNLSDNFGHAMPELASITLSENRVTYNPSLNSSFTSSSSNNRSGQSASERNSFPFYLNNIAHSSAGNVESFQQQCHVNNSVSRQPSSLVTERPFDLDRTDDSSSVASESFSPYHRRPYQDNFFHNIDTLHGYVPPYLQDCTDSDDFSTEASATVLPIQNRFCSLPVRGNTENPQISPQNSSQDSPRKPARICYVDAGSSVGNAEMQQSSASGFSNNENVNCGQKESIFSSGNVHSLSSSIDRGNKTGLHQGALDIQDISVSETGTSSTDNVTGKEFRDAQQLRELRLSNLLRSPSGESTDDPLSPVTPRFPSQNMPRSNSDISMFSVCSETGEKKISHLTAVALRNDAPYPDNACKGRTPLTMSLPSEQETLTHLENHRTRENFQRILDVGQIALGSAKYKQGCEGRQDEGKQTETSIKEVGYMCDMNRNGNAVNVNNKIENDTVVSVDISKCDGKSTVSECSNSSSEKNCVSDKKFLIKLEPKFIEKNVAEIKENRTGKKKKMSSEPGVTFRQACKNKHKVHRYSTGSAPCGKVKRRSLQQDVSEVCKLSPLNDQTSQQSQRRSLNSGGLDCNSDVPDRKDYAEPVVKGSNLGSFQPSSQEIGMKINKSGSFKEYGFIDVPGMKKKGGKSPKSSFGEYSKLNNSLKIGKNSLVANDFNSLRDPTNLQQNVNSKFITVDKISKDCSSGNKHMCDHHNVHKSSKSHGDASLLCPGKGFVRRRSRNSKRNKNRKSYPGAQVTEPYSKDIDFMSSSVVSYSGVKKETEFSSDGVKEKITFPVSNGLLKHGDINDTNYVIEKCSYV